MEKSWRQAPASSSYSPQAAYFGANALYKTPNWNVFTSRSRHTGGGVNVVLCDGSVRFVTNGIAWATWQALGTSRGGEVVGDY
jgi:prepilin-type processing-associated H-X9-DG protein